MVISLSGAGGTGKTTAFDELRRQRPDIACFSEAIRHQMAAFGWPGSKVLELIALIGAGPFNLMCINAQSVIDPAVNTLLKPGQPILLDGGAVNDYGYYLAMRKEGDDFACAELLRAMVLHYASLIDRFVYFPVGVFPLIGDEMRPADTEFQNKIDRGILRAYAELGLEGKLHVLQARGPEDRVAEILGLIAPSQKS